MVAPLSCYNEVSPFEEKGLIELEPYKCKPKSECCLGPKLRKRAEDLKTLAKTVKDNLDKRENKGRQLF